MHSCSPHYSRECFPTTTWHCAMAGVTGNHSAVCSLLRLLRPLRLTLLSKQELSPRNTRCGRAGHPIGISSSPGSLLSFLSPPASFVSGFTSTAGVAHSSLFQERLAS